MSSTLVRKIVKTRLGHAIFTGEVNSDGAPHGRGAFEVVEPGHEGTTYRGTFVNGMREGFGNYTGSDGAVYVGEWKADKRHGFGKVCLYDLSVCNLMSLVYAE
jgi:hypothetical protein